MIPTKLEKGHMEAFASGKATTSGGYIGWQEVFVSGGEKGRKEVRYFLKKRDGSSDLAVVGREKSSRHVSYHYAIRDEVLASIGSSSLSLLKLKSRRDVVDWLNSVVSGSDSSPFVCVKISSSSFFFCQKFLEFFIIPFPIHRFSVRISGLSFKSYLVDLEFISISVFYIWMLFSKPTAFVLSCFHPKSSFVCPLFLGHRDWVFICTIRF